MKDLITHKDYTYEYINGVVLNLYKYGFTVK